MFRNFVCIWSFLATFTCATVFAAPQIVVGVGHSTVGVGDTLLFAQNAALDDAKRMAIEKAGTLIVSNSKVENGILTQDEIMTISAGNIKVKSKTPKYETDPTGSYVDVIMTIEAEIDTDNAETIVKNYLADKEKDKTANEELTRMQQELAELRRQNEALMNKYREASFTQKETIATQIQNNQQRTEMISTVNQMMYNKQFDKAASVVNQAVTSANTLDSYILYLQGMTNFKNGNYNAAASDFMQLESCHDASKYPKSHYYRGIIYYFQKSYKAAYEQFSEANKLLGGNDEDVKFMRTMAMNHLMN